MVRASVTALLLALAPAGSATPRIDDPAEGQAPGPLSVEARLMVPLSGSKTTLRLHVTNRGKQAGVFPPLVNSTQLVLTPPDGKTVEFGRCEENRPADGLGKGESKSWDVDLAGNVDFSKKGNYVVAFRVGGVLSNEVILAVDEPKAKPKKR